MKKFAVLLLSSFLLFGCASNKVVDNTLVDGKVQSAVTLEQLNSLKKDNIREAEILEKLDSTTTYGFDLLNELELAITYEKQQAFNEGYEAGKKDAIAATEGYVKLEDVIELLKKQGLYKEEDE
jgi:hypothetical protein